MACVVNPITPKRWNDATPDSQLMNRKTKGTVYADIAEGLNAATGGSPYQQGRLRALDVSPETLRYWVKSLTGGAGQAALDAYNLPVMLSNDLSPSVKDVPIARRFAREAGVSDARAAFWDKANEAKKAADEFAAAKKAKDAKGIQEIIVDSKPLLKLNKFAVDLEKVIRAKRDEVDRIRNDENLGLKQKQDQMGVIEEAEKAVYDRFIKAFDRDMALAKAEKQAKAANQ